MVPMVPDTMRCMDMPRNRIYPRWMSQVQILAGFYNLLWGSIVVLFPEWSFRLSGMQWPDQPLSYPQLWQCIGMIVGVYGIGYLIAATDPMRHWPIILVGFLGKIFGPIGYIQGGLTGQVPWSAGYTILFNDLIWWVPFFLILRHKYKLFVTEAERTQPQTFESMLDTMRTAQGMSLRELSDKSPVLVVFLRHLGCLFCREALADLAKQRQAIEATGSQLLLVHMSQSEEAEQVFRQYGLQDVAHISDPDCDLYRAFGLKRGTWGQLLGWRAWRRGAVSFLRDGHRVGTLKGDGFRMPGVFVLSRGRVVQSFRHQSAADRPDYLALTNCPVPTIEPTTTTKATA